MISVLALVAALALFLVEQRRANIASARADEAARRLTIESERRVQEVARERECTDIERYREACRHLVQRGDFAAAELANFLRDFGGVNPVAVAKLRDTEGALYEVLRAAPIDPKVIVATRMAATAMKDFLLHYAEGTDKVQIGTGIHRLEMELAAARHTIEYAITERLELILAEASELTAA